MWNDWASWGNEVNDISLGNEKFKDVPTDFDRMGEEELGFWMSRFVLEIKRIDGKEYPPDTIYQIVCAIQRHCNDRSSGKFKHVEIFNQNKAKIN